MFLHTDLNSTVAISARSTSFRPSGGHHWLFGDMWAAWQYFTVLYKQKEVIAKLYLKIKPLPAFVWQHFQLTF